MRSLLCRPGPEPDFGEPIAVHAPTDTDILAVSLGGIANGIPIRVGNTTLGIRNVHPDGIDISRHGVVDHLGDLERSAVVTLKGLADLRTTVNNPLQERLIPTRNRSHKIILSLGDIASDISVYHESGDLKECSHDTALFSKEIF